VYGLKRVMARTDVDRIYPSHADLQVERSVIPELIAGAERVLQGTATGKPVVRHGKKAMAYDIGISVLLCDAE
jgi:hypothetical protein